METAVRTAAQPFVERRRAGSVPPRGMVFVERRRPAIPVLVRDVDDLHDGDAQRFLADALDYGFGAALDPTLVVADLAALIRATAPAALAAHDLRLD